MKILLTFDVEEFDFAEGEEKFELSKKGLLLIKDLLDRHKIKATFFTTALFAKKYPSLISKLESEGHEIACHGYSHSDNYYKDFKKIPLAKEEIERIIQGELKGFRAPRFEIDRISELEDCGFTYDSSIHPTIAPGKYVNLGEKRGIHKKGGVIEVPLSTLPLIPFLRAPINWYMFRHFPEIYNKAFTKINSLFSNHTMLLFHPWEFVNLKKFSAPSSIKEKIRKSIFKSS